jgi:S1-C subfamily serine protease
MNVRIQSLAVLSLFAASPALAEHKLETERMKQAVFIVRPHYHEKTRQMFAAAAREFQTAAARQDDARTKKILEVHAATYAVHADSPGHGSGWLFVARDGTPFVVTNRHVVGEAATVSLESATGNHTRIEDCRVVYVDDRADIAVAEVPRAALPARPVGFEISDRRLQEGMKVFAIGFPGAAGTHQPTYQLTDGIVNNVSVPGSNGNAAAIQHSATIDPGNSGGPLVIEDRRAKIGFRVIGINTWKARNRTNVNLSIPAADIETAMARAETALHVERDPDLLTQKLESSARNLADELGSGRPDVTRLRQLASYAWVAERGPKAFQNIIAGYRRLPEQARALFDTDPVALIREVLFREVVLKRFRPQSQALDSVKFVRFYERDVAGATRDPLHRTVRSVYDVDGQNEEIVWVWERGAWRIGNAFVPRRTEPAPMPAAHPPERGPAGAAPAPTPAAYPSGPAPLRTQNAAPIPPAAMSAAPAAALADAPPAAGAPEQAACVPGCRSGFLCLAGQCVSGCNPPCESAMVCAAGGECVPAAAPAIAPQLTSAAAPLPAIAASAPPAATGDGGPFESAWAAGVALKYALGASVNNQLGTDPGHSRDLQGGAAVSPFADFSIASHVALGAALTYRPSVKEQTLSQADSQVDFLARLTGAASLSPGVRVFGRAGVGYSVVFLPSGTVVNASTGAVSAPNPRGLILEAEAGADIRLGDRIFLSAGLGYAKGFQSTTITLTTGQNADWIHANSYLQLLAAVAFSI